jgi:hypothetical protein
MSSYHCQHMLCMQSAKVGQFDSGNQQALRDHCPALRWHDSARYVDKPQKQVLLDRSTDSMKYQSNAIPGTISVAK